jgi:hypothetical protein
VSDDAFDLEPAPDRPFRPVYDERRVMPEPPPVRLVAISDVTVIARPGHDEELIALYCDVFGMLRDDGRPLRVRAENFSITFEPGDVPIEHSTLRPIGVEVPSLAMLEEKLIDAGIEHLRQQSVQAGQEAILILDAGGNWVEARESVLIG